MCSHLWKELAFVTLSDLRPVRRNYTVLLRYDVRPVTKSQSVLLIQILGPLERAAQHLSNQLEDRDRFSRGNVVPLTQQDRGQCQNLT
jgi:hypothetical protein